MQCLILKKYFLDFLEPSWIFFDLKKIENVSNIGLKTETNSQTEKAAVNMKGTTKIDLFHVIYQFGDSGDSFCPFCLINNQKLLFYSVYVFYRFSFDFSFHIII